MIGFAYARTAEAAPRSLKGMLTEGRREIWLITPVKTQVTTADLKDPFPQQTRE